MADLSPFALLGLPVRFAQEKENIESGWRSAIARVHPDRFVMRPAAERRVAQQWAGRINEAKDVLINPVSRAELLLKLAGVDTGVESDTRMDTDFLMRQMTLREAALDAQGDPAKIKALGEEIDAMRTQLVLELTSAIDEKKDWAAAREFVRRLMFVDKLLQELRRPDQNS